MNGNRRLRSALLVTLITFSSQALSSEQLSHEVEILSPQASEQYFENVDIQFQIEVKDSLANSIHRNLLWRISNRMTKKIDTLSGSNATQSFQEGIYDTEVIFVDSSGEYSMLAQSAFGVLKKPELSLAVTKRKKGALWLISGYESQLAWKGAASEVEIYHKKSCGEGFTRRQSCEAGFRKIYTGKNTGSFSIPYNKDDYFQVCNLGSASSAREFGPLRVITANDSCSPLVIVPRQ